MTSDKSYTNEQRLNSLISTGGAALYGPWTAFNPLQNSWAVQSPYTGAWCRRAPGNTLQISATMTPGTATDGTQIATIPSTDANGSNLRPSQQVVGAMTTDVIRIPGAGTNQEGVYFSLTSAGNMFCHGVAGSATTASINVSVPLDSM